MSDINDNVSEQGSDIEQVGGQAESDLEYDSDMYMEGGKIDMRDARRQIQKLGMGGLNLATLVPRTLVGSALSITNKALLGIPEGLVNELRSFPIIDGGYTGRMHQKVNQNNIGKHVIHDPCFRRSVKTATNPVFQHGITQYEAFDLFNGFKTCTVELLDELIRYFKNALSEQDTFTKSEWKKRYPKKGGRTKEGKLMVTKDQEKPLDDNATRPSEEEDEFFGGATEGEDKDADDNLEADESSTNKVEDKDIAIAFTDKVEAFRTGAKFTKGSTMKNSPFEGTDAIKYFGKLKSNDEGKNRSNRYPLGWKEKNKEQNKKESKEGDPPTFLKLMEKEEIFAILEHLTNIRKILTITTDIEIARNFINPSSDNKKNYLKTTNIKEEEIQDNVFNGDSRTEDSQFEEKKNDILQNIYLTNDAVNKAAKNRDRNAEQDAEEIKRNEKNKKALDLYYNMKNENRITISLPPKFLLKSLKDKEKFEKNK